MDSVVLDSWDIWVDVGVKVVLFKVSALIGASPSLSSLSSSKFVMSEAALFFERYLCMGAGGSDSCGCWFVRANDRAEEELGSHLFVFQHEVLW